MCLLALQDAVDALEPKAAPESEAMAVESESQVMSEMADNSTSVMIQCLSALSCWCQGKTSGRS